MKNIILQILALGLVLFTMKLSAQNASKKDTAEMTKKQGLEVSGYIQAQYQYADSMGAPARFAGGDFPRFSQNRFSLRRGRLKIAHHSHFSEAAIAIDINDRGLQLKDAYITLTEPWLQTFGVTAGVFYIPFGFETGYSSALRESPERARVIQNLFPMERDMGVSLNINPPAKSKLHFLSFTAGIFNGNAINQETDVFKDYCARLRISNPFRSKWIEYSVGISYYNGGLNYIYDLDGKPLDRRYVFSMTTVDHGYAKGFDVDSAVSFRDTADFYAGKSGGTRTPRKYYGADLQLGFNFPFGKTILRGEYIYGTQSSPVYTLAAGIKYQSFYNWSSVSYTGYQMGVSWPIYDSPQPVNPAVVVPTHKLYDIFIRDFRGFCFCFIQGITHTGVELVFKYDFYDPNTRVKGKEVDFNIYQRDSAGNILTNPEGIPLTDPNRATFLSPADISYTTYGFGINYTFRNFRIMAYFDYIKNEITAIAPYKGDISKGLMPNPGFKKDQKDNLLTIRLQYRF